MAALRKEHKEILPQMVVNYSNENGKTNNESTGAIDPATDGSSAQLPTQRNFNSLLFPEAKKLIELALKDERASKVNSIFIKANDQIINLKLSDVLWVEAYGDYVNFITEKTRYLVHSTMKAIESRLPIDQFTRVHRSFIIRPDKIDLIEESLVQIGKKLIPIGESYRSDFFSKLNIL